jgi:hypothetical protein
MNSIKSYHPADFENLTVIVGLLLLAGIYIFKSPAEGMKVVTPIATGLLGYMKGRADK